MGGGIREQQGPAPPPGSCITCVSEVAASVNKQPCFQMGESALPRPAGGREGPWSRHRPRSKGRVQAAGSGVLQALPPPHPLDPCPSGKAWFHLCGFPSPSPPHPPSPQTVWKELHPTPALRGVLTALWDRGGERGGTPSPTCRTHPTPTGAAAEATWAGFWSWVAGMSPGCGGRVAVQPRAPPPACWPRPLGSPPTRVPATQHPGERQKKKKTLYNLSLELVSSCQEERVN